MRILITNDDGVFAEGIRLLAEWAKKLGEVTIVAPKREQSGKSHAINFTEPMEIKRVDLMDGVEAYSCDSTPADCVRYGIAGLNRTYDLVLSGINRGVNLGVDMIYSGTVAAIFEAAYWNHNALAFSTYPDAAEDAAKELDNIYNYIKDRKLFDYNPIYNVNIPADAKGIRITRMGGHYYSDDFVPQGDDLFMPHGKCVHENKNDLTLDTDCVVNGYISIMPLTINRTNMDIYNKLSQLNK